MGTSVKVYLRCVGYSFTDIQSKSKCTGTSVKVYLRCVG